MIKMAKDIVFNLAKKNYITEKDKRQYEILFEMNIDILPDHIKEKANKIQEFKLFNFVENQIFGIEFCLLKLNSCYAVKISSETACIYSIENSIFKESIFIASPKSQEVYTEYAINRFDIILKKMNNILSDYFTDNFPNALIAKKKIIPTAIERNSHRRRTSLIPDNFKFKSKLKNIFNEKLELSNKIIEDNNDNENVNENVNKPFQRRDKRSITSVIRQPIKKDFDTDLNLSGNSFEKLKKSKKDRSKPFLGNIAGEELFSNNKNAFKLNSFRSSNENKNFNNLISQTHGDKI